MQCVDSLQVEAGGHRAAGLHVMLALNFRAHEHSGHPDIADITGLLPKCVQFWLVPSRLYKALIKDVQHVCLAYCLHQTKKKIIKLKVFDEVVKLFLHK